MSAPPPVPALPDTARITTFSLSSSTGPCPVGFQIYADGTDVDQWIKVTINSLPKLSTDPSSGWSLSSVTGPIGSIPRPITDAILTFNSLQTGNITIVGAQRPRRLSQFSENRGVPARDLNQVITGETAMLREMWDRAITADGVPTNGQVALWTSPNTLMGVDPAIFGGGSGGGGGGAAAWVNVKDFGAIGNGVADDTAAIQVAIDHAWAFSLTTIYLPSGTYKISSSLYLDPPGNLRSNFANPTIFSFSLCLMGDEGVGNHEGFGTRIQCTFNNTTAIYVGTGQGMMVKNLNVFAAPAAGGHNYHKQLDAGGIGIGICGGSGGASRTLFENVWVESFYKGFATSANGNINLGDSNTWIKCTVINAAVAWSFGGIENFINNLFACQAGDFATAIDSSLNVGVNIFGGNWSSSGAGIGQAISSVSALTTIVHGNYNTYRVSVTLTNTPDAGFSANLANCIFNAFTLATAHFGIVPFTIVSINIGTKIVVLETTVPWSQYNFGGIDAKASTNLQTELQAATTLYCCEWVQTFRGFINAYNVHIESPQGAICLIDTSSGFGDNRASAINGCWFNYDPGFSNLLPVSGMTDRSKALFYTAKTFPLISVTRNLDLRNCMFTCSDPVIADVYAPGRLTVNMVEGFFVNTRIIDPSGNNFAPFNPNIPAESMVASDRLLQVGNFAAAFADEWRREWGGSAPAWGWRPAVYATPAIRAADYATLVSGSLPAINNNGNLAAVTYPLLWGGQNYAVSDYFGAPATSNYGKTFFSSHNFYTYGQNLTTTQIPSLSWNYLGQSFVVNVNDQTMMFPGLGITLNDGSSDVQYIVTGVYPGLGYMTVMGIASQPSQSGLSGTKTSTITGTVIKQQAYAITTSSQATNARNTAQFDKTTSTVLANVTGLSVPVVAGRSYEFKATLYCTCAAAGGAQVAIAGTATATAIRYGAKTYTGTTLNVAAQASALATSVGGSTTAVDRIEIDGTIVVNAAGTLTVQFAQNASSGTSSVLIGSSFSVRDIT